MDCNAYRDEFSALLDTEDPMLAPGVLDAHLARCVDCTQWAEAATQLHRATRVAPAPDVPDLVAPILAAAAQRAAITPAFDRGALIRVARLALASIGIAELISAMQGLFSNADAGSALHSVHELGSFDVALGVGFLCAAFRPALARGMLPVVVALVATLAAVTVADIQASHAGWAGESVHLLALFGVPMLWIAGRFSAEEGPISGGLRPVSPGLRAA